MSRVFVVCTPQVMNDAYQAVFDHLVRRYGAWRVRWAHDQDLWGGSETRKGSGVKIQRTVGHCAVLIVPITPGLSLRVLPAEPAGGGELTDQAEATLWGPHSRQRQLVAAALQAPRTLVIPILLDGASMPRPSDLPPELAPLAFRNAVRLPQHREDVPLFLDQAVVHSMQTFLPTYERANHPRLAVVSALGIVVPTLVWYAFLCFEATLAVLGLRLDVFTISLPLDQIVTTGTSLAVISNPLAHTICDASAILLDLMEGAAVLSLPVCWLVCIALATWWHRWLWVFALAGLCWTGPVILLIFAAFGPIGRDNRAISAEYLTAVWRNFVAQKAMSQYDYNYRQTLLSKWVVGRTGTDTTQAEE